MASHSIILYNSMVSCWDNIFVGSVVVTVDTIVVKSGVRDLCVFGWMKRVEYN